MLRRLLLPVCLLVCLHSQSVALDPNDSDVFVRVVDVGAGLSCVVQIKDGDERHYVVYDAGNWQDNGASAMAQIRQIIPDDEEIDLLVLSHSDSDHLGAVDEMFEEYVVRRVIRAGLFRDTNTWETANRAILDAKEEEGTKDINLRYFEFPPGATYRFGDAFVTMVCGFHLPPRNWDIDGTSEERNGGSIVIRLEYKGKSVLFCGDAVGRHNGDPDDAHIATEKYMVDFSPVIKIDSDVIVAPHHGADNGSSTKFIEAVTPEWVIFSAGHKYGHPRKTTADRYIAAGVTVDKMFRTDRGDDENSNKEWKQGSINSHHDPIGDDDVDVAITANDTATTVKVKYRTD